MMIYDVYSRYKCGRPLNYMHALRNAIFVYGASTPWLIGGYKNFAPFGYREWNDLNLKHFFELAYRGYFGSGFLNCFTHTLTVNGEAYGFSYTNILPIELLIFFLGKCAIWGAKDGFKRRNKWVHFINSLWEVHRTFFIFPFFVWAVFFIKQHVDLHFLEKDGNGVTGRSNINYIFSWILSVWMILEFLYWIFEIYYFGSIQNFSKVLFAESPIGKDPRDVPELNHKNNHLSEERQTLLLNNTPESKLSQDELPSDLESYPDSCSFQYVQTEY